MKRASSSTHFESNQKKFFTAPKTRNESEINYDYTITDYFLTHLESFQGIKELIISPLPEEDSAYQYLPHLAKSRVLGTSELHLIALIIESSSVFLRSLPRDESSIPFFCPHIPSELLQFVRDFRKIVSKNGEIDYFGDPELGRLYKQVREIEKNIRLTVQGLAQSKSLSSRLQYSEHDIINERFVLAVRSDSYDAQIGQIVSRSASGLTLFVEPFEVKEISNKWLILSAQIDALIESLCQKFSQTLSPHCESILQLKDLLFTFDDFYSRATFAQAFKLTRPKLSSSSLSIQIKDLFHPLIETPQPNDITIGEDKNGLILSGPNTGGKTVFLKNLSLCYLLVHKGFFVPAKQAKLHLYSKVFYFSNDFQNLEKGLSSFASESLRYLEMVNALNQESLIVIDEIFNSTSSEEASSLSLGLIDIILKKSRSKIIISTHHQLLKTLIHQDKSFVSAHMLFDIENNQPLYQINIGTPGSSLAFIIFNRLINSYFSSSPQFKDITNIAQKVFDKKQASYESLLQELSQKNAELSKLLLENREINQQLKNQRQSMQGLLDLEKKEKLEEAEQEIKSVINEAFKLKKSSRELGQKQLELKAREIKLKLQNLTPQSTSPVKKSMFTVENFKEGQQVIHLQSNKKYTIDSINHRKSSLLIASGPFRLWVSPDELSPSDKRHQTRDIVVITPSPEEELLVTEIDCRGMRLEEFKEVVLKSLDFLLRGELPFITFIHGHGDGVLKNWLRQYLKTSKDFNWNSPDGNDGCTEVKVG